MSKKKEELGKGLRALLSNIDKIESSPAEKQEAIKELTQNTAEIPISKISPNPYQPRQEFDQTELLQLVQSIKSVGLIQPITVRKIDHDNFQIISGERRWRASKLAGLKLIPAYIRVADDQGMVEMALIENIQRSDLNPLEVALSYQRLIEECQLQHNELADRVGKQRSTVSNYIRLLKLPPDIQSGLKNKSLSMGHARALISVENPDLQLDLYKRIISDNLSVRATENLIQSYSAKKSPKSASAPQSAMHPEVRKIQDRLSHHFGSKVEINRKSDGKGKLIIHFNSDRQFNEILDNIEE